MSTCAFAVSLCSALAAPYPASLVLAVPSHEVLNIISQPQWRNSHTHCSLHTRSHQLSVDHLTQRYTTAYIRESVASIFVGMVHWP